MKACIGGDLNYLRALIEMYGLDTKIRTVWELEQERLFLDKFKEKIGKEALDKNEQGKPME